MPEYGAMTLTLQSAPVAAAIAAADSAGRYVVAPFGGRVTAAGVICATAITGANTESRTIQVHNRSNSDALVASKAFVSGVNAAADAVTALTVTATAADALVDEGDILEITSLHVGSTGLAGPEFAALVTFQREVA